MKLEDLIKKARCKGMTALSEDEVSDGVKEMAKEVLVGISFGNHCKTPVTKSDLVYTIDLLKPYFSGLSYELFAVNILDLLFELMNDSDYQQLARCKGKAVSSGVIIKENTDANGNVIWNVGDFHPVLFWDAAAYATEELLYGMKDLSENILSSIKVLLGLSEENSDFDNNLMIYINSAIFSLRQLGVGPLEKPYSITPDNVKTATYQDYLGETYAKETNDVKTYIYYKVLLSFDPPSNASALEMVKSALKESEWRLTANVELPTLNGKEENQNGADHVSVRQ